MSGPALFLDRTVLASPELAAALVMAAQGSGRQCVYNAADRHALLWYSAGQVLGAAYNEEQHALDRFHCEAAEALRDIIPVNARLDSAVAPIAFLARAESEGWIRPIDRRGDAHLLQFILMSQPASVLDGLSQWEGSLDEFIGQPFVDLAMPSSGMSSQERDQGTRAYLALGSDAPRCMQLIDERVNWFETDLYRVFRDWLDENPDKLQAIQGCGSTVGAVRSGHTFDLECQVSGQLARRHLGVHRW